MYNKNIKKEIEGDLRRWKDLSSSWIDRIYIMKWLHYQNQSVPHPIKIPTTFLSD
jgi:hypothetical protein